MFLSLRLFSFLFCLDLCLAVSLSRREINEPRGVCPAGIRSGAASESFGCNMAANLVSSGSGAVYFYFPSADGSFYFGTFFFFSCGGERVLLLPWLVSMLFPLCILFSREYIMTRAMRIFDHAACVLCIAPFSLYVVLLYIYRPQYIVHQFDCPYDFEYI